MCRRVMRKFQGEPLFQIVIRVSFLRVGDFASRLMASGSPSTDTSKIFHINDGFSTWFNNCRAAHMLNGCRQAAERNRDPSPKN
jgi:hypothetical protein